MAYEKQTWQTGDVITATKLNHMEDGIADSDNCLIVNINQGTTLDKTVGEIWEMYSNGKQVRLRNETDEIIQVRTVTDVYFENDDGWLCEIYTSHATGISWRANANTWDELMSLYPTRHQG